jgi:hypothetical protein
MELKIIILSKISQNEKGKYHLFSYMWNLGFDKLHEYKMGTIFLRGEPQRKRWVKGEGEGRL